MRKFPYLLCRLHKIRHHDHIHPDKMFEQNYSQRNNKQQTKNQKKKQTKTKKKEGELVVFLPVSTAAAEGFPVRSDRGWKP